jgi:hypothetical protein
MRCILVLICLLQMEFSFSQFSAEENEMMEIVKVHGIDIPPSLFLTESTVKHMQLANANSWRHIWSDIDDSIKHVMQFYDIRLRFDGKREALKFHKKYLGLNSEFGPKIRQHGIQSQGSDDFIVFSGSKVYNKMMDPYGFQIYCLLFVVDNYFVKLYLTCLKEYPPSQFQSYVTEAILKIKSL